MCERGIEKEIETERNGESDTERDAENVYVRELAKDGRTPVAFYEQVRRHLECSCRHPVYLPSPATT